MNFDRLRDFMNDSGARIGRYEIVREVGRGGMGVVYEAYDPDLKRTIALKVLKQADADRLRREASAAAKLRHPNIVTVYEVGADHLAMEFISGGPARIDRATLETVAKAVAYAHEQGVVHRDLKPGNILADAGGRVVLSDFGLEGLGTPGYRAPEGVTGPAVDVHALKVMAKEAGLRVSGETAAEIARSLRPRRRWPWALLPLAAAVVVFWPGERDPQLRAWRDQEHAITLKLAENAGRVELWQKRGEIRLARTDFGRNRGRNPLPDFAGAESDLDRALALKPGSKELLFLRGKVRTQRAVYKTKYGIDALSDCAAAEKDLLAAGDWPGAQTWLGNVRYHRGDFAQAERDLTPAGDPDRLMRRGRARAAMKRYDEAEADFAESLKQRADNVWAWTWRGNARLAAGDPEGAERSYSEAIRVDAEFSEAWEGRGNARKARGNADGAAADYREALRLDPSLESRISR